MWQEIEASIYRESGKPFHIKSKQTITQFEHQNFSTSFSSSPVPVNLSLLIGNGDQQYFVKLADKHHYQNFETEAYSLDKLNKLSAIECPKVTSLGLTEDKSFLVLEHIHFARAKPVLWYNLGQQLALTHQEVVHGQFGWQYDNYLRGTSQPNQWSSNWSTFFSEQRIAWQLQLLHEKSIVLGDIDYITQFCHDMLSNHYVAPSLLHGDLWLGNTGFTSTKSLLFDPASYYGDREVDIATSELFGQFPASFYHGYQDNYPLEKGYLNRKAVYNLYPILNNANIFGGIYIDQAKAALTHLMSLKPH